MARGKYKRRGSANARAVSGDHKSTPTTTSSEPIPSPSPSSSSPVSIEPRTLVLATGMTLSESEGHFVVLDGVAYLTLKGLVHVSPTDPDIDASMRVFLVGKIGPLGNK